MRRRLAARAASRVNPRLAAIDKRASLTHALIDRAGR
jgi:hypothetical protein